MFRRNRMLRNLFGSPCEKAEARRTKPMVKPHLEELMDRILPSASSLPVVSVASPPSAPQVAAATSSLASTMDQLGHLIATVEQNVIGAYQVLGQEASYVLYQLDHLLGITLNAPNQPLNTAMQQAGSGSGSGSGAMSTDHEGSEIQPIISNTQNQPLSRKTQLAGSGSGTDSVGQSFVWEPMTGGDYLWSDPNNWSSHAVPQNGAPATFSGTYNSHCIVDSNTTQGTIYLENGFTAPIEIENGDTLNIPGFDDLDIPADVFNVQFLGANAVQNFKTGQDFMGDFNWEAGGKTTVNGASVYIGMQAGLNQSTASPIIINSGGVNIGPISANSGTSTFKLTNGSADINVNANGGLNFSMPTVAATTLVDNTGTAAQISNNGTVSLVNSPGGGTAKIAVPLENHATLNANQGGLWNFTAADNNGNDLYMDAGKITMSGGVSISCNHAYTQSGGTLEIADNKVESLLVFPGKPTNFNGGKIVFNPSTGWGILSLDIATFNGVEIDMRIAGNAGSPANDQIQCRGAGGNTCTIQGNSKLVVTAVNAVQPKLTWTLITPGAGNKIAGDFLAANITLPNGVKETVGALPNSWQCNS